MSGSWLESLQGYATAALAAGEEAGAAVYDQLASAIARVEALPVEALSAVSGLTDAIGALFPDVPAHGEISEPAAPATGAGSLLPPGQVGAIGGTVRPVPLPRRFRVDQAAFAAFILAQHPHKPAEHASAATGVPLETVAKILQRESLPMGRTFLRFVAAYGPELLRAVLPDAPLVWLEGARILADQSRLAAEQARITAEAEANAGRWSLCGISFGGLT